MQRLAWDDLRYLLAASRTGSYPAAARRLGVDDTTVSRRLRALQRAAGTEMIARRPDGTLRLTPAGEAVAARAERIEAEAQGAGRALLPCVASARDPRLSAMSQDDLPPPPGREVWLLAHAERRDFAAVRATIDWITSLEWSEG